MSLAVSALRRDDPFSNVISGSADRGRIALANRIRATACDSYRLTGGGVRAAVRCCIALCAAFDPTGPETPPGPAVVVALVYELLDAHADTTLLAAELSNDPRWAAHLDYLRALQRVGRERLAQSCCEVAA